MKGMLRDYDRYFDLNLQYQLNNVGCDNKLKFIP